MASTSRKHEEGTTTTCPNCDSKTRKLTSENGKLRNKIQDLTGRRDHYANLYYETVAELDAYKRKIEWIVKDLEELGVAGGEHGPGSVLKNGLKNGFRDGEASTQHGPHEPSKQKMHLYRTKHHLSCLHQQLCKGQPQQQQQQQQESLQQQQQQLQQHLEHDLLTSTRSAPILTQHQPMAPAPGPTTRPQPHSHAPAPAPVPHPQQQRPQQPPHLVYPHGPPPHLRHQQAPPPPINPPPPMPPKFLQLQRRPTVPLPGGRTPPDLVPPFLGHSMKECCNSCGSCTVNQPRMLTSNSNTQSIDSACFCTGSDTSDSPIYEDNQLQLEVGPPSPYRALRQRSLRNKVEPTWVPIQRQRGRSENVQVHIPGYIKKGKARARRVASDPDIFRKKGNGTHSSSSSPAVVPVHVTHYQELSLRELSELAAFLTTSECNFAALEIVDSHLGAEDMMTALCNGLTGNATVQELSLPHNGINSLSMETLFGMLLKNPTNISTLRLCSNNIGAECFSILKDFLLDTSLKCLDLRSNSIASSEKHCSQLREVNANCELLCSQSPSVKSQSLP